MSFKITASAPTGYQLSSLKQFGMPVTDNGNGRLSSIMIYDTEQEAKDYLIERAKMYYDEYEGQVDPYIDDINQYGFLEIDAVSAYIFEIEDEYDY